MPQPCRAYGAHVRASCAPYVTEAPCRGPLLRASTRTSLGRAVLTAYRVVHCRHRCDGRHAAARGVPDGDGRGRRARACADAARAAREPRPCAGGRAGPTAALLRQRRRSCVDNKPGMAGQSRSQAAERPRLAGALGGLRHDLVHKQAAGAPAFTQPSLSLHSAFAEA